MNPQFQIDPRQVVANLKAQLVSQEKLLEVHRQSRHNLREAVRLGDEIMKAVELVDDARTGALGLIARMNGYMAQSQLVQFEHNVRRLEVDIENMNAQIKQLDSPIMNVSPRIVS